jgi:hypothetical protein
VVIPPAEASFLGQGGKEMMIEYQTARPAVGSEDTPSLLITTQKKWICVERNGYFVELSIHSSSEDFDFYQPGYDQAKNSMSFR